MSAIDSPIQSAKVVRLEAANVYALSIEFRVLFLAILGVIVPFGLLLYFWPGRTDFYWAWNIANPRSAILIGAGYVGAIAYYLLALRENDWRQVRKGMGGLIVFSVVLLIATMADWDTFKVYHPITLVWLVFYYAGPFLVPALYRQQEARMPAAPDRDEVPISSAWRAWLVARGASYALVALLGFIFADWLAGVWAWSIHPLELRVFTGQVAIIGWNAVAAFQPGLTWRGLRLGTYLTLAIGIIQLAGLLMHQTSYNWSSPFGVLLPLMFVEWVVTPLLLIWAHREKRGVH